MHSILVKSETGGLSDDRLVQAKESPRCVFLFLFFVLRVEEEAPSAVSMRIEDVSRVPRFRTYIGNGWRPCFSGKTWLQTFIGSFVHDIDLVEYCARYET